MKQKKKKQIFSKHYDGMLAKVLFSHLPTDLQPDDEIDISRVERYVSENESHDEYTELAVFRMIEETDDEYQRRMERAEWDAKWAKERRHASYLKLKEEFEPTT